MEAVRQGVQQEAADELVGIEGHHLGLAVRSVVLPGEADLAVGERDQPAVGDGDAMGVAAEIGQHLFGARRTVAWRRPPSRGAGVRRDDGEGLRARQGWRACRRTAACRRRRRSPAPARTAGGTAARARAPAGRSRGGKRPSGCRRVRARRRERRNGRADDAAGSGPRCGEPWSCRAWRRDAWDRPRWWRVSRPPRGTGSHRRRPCSGTRSRRPAPAA